MTPIRQRADLTERVRSIVLALARTKRGLSLDELVERLPVELELGEFETLHHLRALEGNGYVRRLTPPHAKTRWQLTELSGRSAALAWRRRAA